jgi:hypothetical protein
LLSSEGVLLGAGTLAREIRVASIGPNAVEDGNTIWKVTVNRAYRNVGDLGDVAGGEFVAAFGSKDDTSSVFDRLDLPPCPILFWLSPQWPALGVRGWGRIVFPIGSRLLRTGHNSSWPIEKIEGSLFSPSLRAGSA